MAWFKRQSVELDASGEKKIRTEGLWVKCEGCRQIIWKKDLEENLNVCPKCGKHFRIDARTRPGDARAHIGVQLQSTSFQKELTIRELVRLYAGLYGASRSKSAADEHLAAVHLDEEAGKRFGQLPGGHLAPPQASADLGGVLSDGMMDQWDLNLSPSGVPVESGIFSEMYDRLGEAFSPQAASRTLAEMLAAQPRIAVRYGERPVAVGRRPWRDGTEVVESVTFGAAESDSRSTIRAPFIVDATDNGDVAALAGAHYDLGRQDTGVDERMQPVTVMFTLEGVDWAKLEDSYEP